MSATQWFVKSGVSALVLLLACGLATAWFGDAPNLPSTTTRDGTLITLNRYAREPIPEIVLVGSSLTFRLKEEYFATPGLRNLALAGGSPVTGLEIVANQPRLPKIILVEANVLSRATDMALVGKYSRGTAEPLFFRPIRAAIAAYENWRHAPLTHAQSSLALGRLLAQPPSDFDNRIYVERALQQEKTADPAATAVQVNAERIKEVIATVEQRGARVLLFELPFSAQLEESRSAQITREVVHARFPDPDRWLRVDFARSELRWADGIHLDERSAVIIAQAIDKALSSLSGSR